MSKEIQPTHGVEVTDVDSFGVKRNMSALLLSNDTYVFSLTTHWEPDTDPTITVIRLTPIALSMLTALLLETMENIHNYPMKVSA